MNPTQLTAMEDVLGDVHAERQRQHAVHGEQSLDNGLWHCEVDWPEVLNEARELQSIWPEWGDVLIEEVAEVYLTRTPADLRAELIQVAAVCVQWVEALDRAAQAKQPPASSANAADEGQGKGASARVDPAPSCCVGGPVGPSCGACEIYGAELNQVGWDANRSEVPR